MSRDQIIEVVNDNMATKSSFGDDLSESFEPIVQMSAVYGINGDAETFTASNGTATTNNNQFECNITTDIGSYSVIRTKRPIVYREGQGMTARFTATFDGNAVANSLQFAGFFNLTDTVAFGYRGTNFGIIYDTYGEPETRSLQITTAGNGTLTLTLNGTAYNIPITTGTVQHNAYEIEVWMNANQSAWNVQQENDTVTFQARATEVRNGTYSVSGGGLAGTFTQIKSGVAKTEATYSQSAWNKDIASWFDPTKPNVYMIKLSYLGFGPLRFYILNPNTSEYTLVHEILLAGTSATKTNISKRSMKIGWICASLGSTTALTVKGGSAAGFIDGQSRVFGQANAISNTNTSVDSIYESVVSIRTKEVYKSNVMLGRLVPINLTIANDATKPVEYIIVKNASYGETNYLSYGTDSIAQYDMSNGAIVGSNIGPWQGVMSAGGSQVIDLSDLNISLELNESLTIFARKTSGTNPSVTASIIWKEDF